MRAILFDPDDRSALRQVDLPIPSVGVGDVRIRVASMSFNPVDFQPPTAPPDGGTAPVAMLGRDLSGVIDAVGADVDALAPGDEVYCYVCRLGSSGACADYVTVPAELVARKPRRLTHDQAAGVPVVGVTALLALEKARLRDGSSLLVLGGAGGVGTFAILLAQNRGAAHVMTTAGNPQSRAYLKAQCGLGDHQIVDYRRADFIDHLIDCNGGLFESVIDLVGGEMLAAGCRLLAPDANLVSAVNPPTPDDFEFLFQRNASFHAVGANAYSLVDSRATWARYRQMLDALSSAFDTQDLKIPATANLGDFSVATVQRARDLLQRTSVQGKLVMTVHATPAALP